MNRRERVLVALRGDQPDKVPFLETEVEDELTRELLGKDECQPHEIADLLGLDGFGVFVWPPVYAESHKTGAGHAYQGRGLIQDYADLKLLDPPDPDDESLYEPVRALVKRYHGEYALFAGSMIGWHPALWLPDPFP